MYTLIIRGGMVLDGTGSPPVRKDIALQEDTVCFLGSLDSTQGAECIDAGGMFVCPGFIDMHAHSEFNVLVYPPGQSKIQQGVTTEVCGNCGLSAAPLLGAALQHRSEQLRTRGMEVTWSTFEEYVRVVQEKDLASNIALLVGHGNIRGSVIGYNAIQPSSADMKQMTVLLEQAMQAGAWGLSSGLLYPPGVYAQKQELADLAGVAAACGGIYASHIRSEGDFLLEAIAEALSIGRASGAPVHISHLKTLGSKNWHKLSDVLSLIDEARREGLNVTADRYPYTASNTGLDVLLPPWACRGGAADELERLRSDTLRDRIYAEILTGTTEQEIGEKTRIAGVVSEPNRPLEGRTLAEAARLRGQPLKDTFFDLLVEEALDVDALFFSMSEDNLMRILKQHYVAVGSDAAVRDVQGTLSAGKPHPRAFGTFPRIIETYVASRRLIPLEQAVYKMTGLPAAILGLSDRGVLSPGAKADIVIFRPDEVHDNATYEEPHRYPSGIHHVIVNGKPVLRQAVLTDTYPGKVLLKKG